MVLLLPANHSDDDQPQRVLAWAIHPQIALTRTMHLQDGSTQAQPATNPVLLYDQNTESFFPFFLRCNR